MPAPYDTSSDDLSFEWENATQANQYRAVKPGTTSDKCDLATANTDVPLGIIQNNPKLGQHGAVRQTKLSYWEAGGVISAGVGLVPTTGGKAAAYSHAGAYNASATYTMATALSASAADGDYMTVDMWRSHAND